MVMLVYQLQKLCYLFILHKMFLRLFLKWIIANLLENFMGEMPLWCMLVTSAEDHGFLVNCRFNSKTMKLFQEEYKVFCTCSISKMFGFKFQNAEDHNLIMQSKLILNTILNTCITFYKKDNKYSKVFLKSLIRNLIFT
jgi:hypothetical protein